MATLTPLSLSQRHPCFCCCLARSFLFLVPGAGQFLAWTIFAYQATQMRLPTSTSNAGLAEGQWELWARVIPLEPYVAALIVSSTPVEGNRVKFDLGQATKEFDRYAVGTRCGRLLPGTGCGSMSCHVLRPHHTSAGLQPDNSLSPNISYQFCVFT